MLLLIGWREARISYRDEHMLLPTRAGRRSMFYLDDGAWHHLAFRKAARTGEQSIWLDGQAPARCWAPPVVCAGVCVHGAHVYACACARVGAVRRARARATRVRAVCGVQKAEAARPSSR